VSTVGAVIDAGIPWVFSDGNCGAILTGYYDSRDELDAKVDWPLQRQQMWNSTADDPTRETRRAAEFLVYMLMPWSLVRWLVVRSEAAAATVGAHLSEAGESREVLVRPQWYYSGSRYR
jgi:ssDNA thymidine ADP-ribosyltransferase, DarT